MSYTSLHSKTYSVGSFNSADFVMRYNITFLCQFSMLLFYFDFGLFICFQIELTELDAKNSNYYICTYSSPIPSCYQNFYQEHYSEPSEKLKALSNMDLEEKVLFCSMNITCKNIFGC